MGSFEDKQKVMSSSHKLEKKTQHLEDEKLPSFVTNDQLVIPITTYVSKTNAILCNSTLNLSGVFECGTCVNS